MTNLDRTTAFGIAVVVSAVLGCGGQSRAHRENEGRGGSMASGGGAGNAAGSASGGIETGGLGGAAGSGGSGASGSAGASFVPDLPTPPVPLGVFGELVDRFILARVSAVQSWCCNEVCCDDPDDLPIACLEAQYLNLVPNAGWLACASRLAATDAEVSTYLSMHAACYESCAARNWTLECQGIEPADSCNQCESAAEPTALTDCIVNCTFNGRVCNGTEECASGSDELNCDPGARSYQCASGENVPWLSLCDGTAACPDASDEQVCVP